MRHQPHTRLFTPRAPPSCRSQPHPARILPPPPYPSLYPSVPKQYYSFFLQHCTHATAGALGKSYPTMPSCNLAPASRAWCSRVVCVRVRQCARLIKKKNAGDREGERMCARPTARIHLRVCAYTCNREKDAGWEGGAGGEKPELAGTTQAPVSGSPGPGGRCACQSAQR